MYLHTLNLSTPSQEVSLTLPEDFSVAGGINTSGQLVFPTCVNPSYLVAGGPECLAYAPRLGHGAVKQIFVFPVIVTTLLVATESGLRPIPEVYVGPRNLAPELVTLKTCTQTAVRSKYSDNYEYINYYTFECVWQRSDTNEILAPGPDAPQIIYQFFAQGTEPLKYIGYKLSDLKSPAFAGIVRFVDDFATL